MLGIDEGADATLLLCFGEAMQRERGLAGGFRSVNFNDATARQAADAERDVEPERAGGDGIDLHRLVVLAELHDRALAKGALDLGQRRIKSFRLVHGRTFNDAQRCSHVTLPYAPRFGTAPNRAPGRQGPTRMVYPICSHRAMFFFRSYRSTGTGLF